MRIISSLLMALNAFLKSNLSTAWPGMMFCKNRRTACADASVPRFTPNPSCTGAIFAAIFSWTTFAADLATSLRKVQPTAMGLMPPSFLVRAHSDAPQKTGWMDEGTLPARHRFANPLKCETNFFPASPVRGLVISFKCWGRMPSHPPAEPAGNDLMASITSHSNKTSGGGAELFCNSGVDEASMETDRRNGCFRRKTAKVFSSRGANMSSLTARRMAPLTSPSSNFSDMRAAILSTEVICRCPLDCLVNFSCRMALG